MQPDGCSCLTTNRQIKISHLAPVVQKLDDAIDWINHHPEDTASIRAGLSLRAGGRGFSPATKRVAPSYFYWKIEEK